MERAKERDELGVVLHPDPFVVPVEHVRFVLVDRDRIEPVDLRGEVPEVLCVWGGGRGGGRGEWGKRGVAGGANVRVSFTTVVTR